MLPQTSIAPVTRVPRFKRMHRRSLFVCIAVLISSQTSATTAASADSTSTPITRSYLGLTLPRPIRLAPDTLSVHLPSTKLERLVPVELSIDSSGTVTTIVADVAGDSSVVAWCSDYLKTFSWAPGEIDAKAASIRLPIDLWVTPDVARPVPLFPVDSLGIIASVGRYEHALERNGVSPAAIQRFPSLFSDLKLPDTATSYRYVLVRLTIDQSGRLKKAAVVSTNYPDRADLVVAAANWATFKPARVRKKSTSSTCFLLVLFSPTIGYPTKAWTPKAADSLPPLQKYMVRLLADSSNLMSEPIPRHAPRGEADFPELKFGIRDSLSLLVKIDTAGYPAIIRTTPDRRERARLEGIVSRRLRFYPALDFEGRPMTFFGIIKFVSLDVKKVRISYSWLP